MGEIIFEGAPPYGRLDAQSAEAKSTLDGVEMVLTVSVEGPSTPTAPLLILLPPAVARALAGQLGAVAEAADRLMKNLR
jgi:hypothetical protein